MKKGVITLLLFYVCSFYCFGQNWIKLREGIKPPNNLVLTLEPHGGDLFITGNIKKDGEGNFLGGLTSWNGNTFLKYAHGLPYTPRSYHAFRYRDSLYVSSYLEYDGVHTLAYYNETLDSFMLTSDKVLNGVVGSSLEVNDTLYLSGLFTKCGEDTTWGFCMYDGNHWHSLFSQPRDSLGVDNFLEFIWYKNELYVGGNFYLLDADSNYIRDVAILRDGKLHSFGGELNFTGLGYTSAFAIFNNDLYIAGYFIEANGMPVGHIVKWDGFQFTDVGGGANDYITDIMVYKDNLYISGPFTHVSGVYAPNIARWDGNKWYGITYDDFGNGSGIIDMEMYNDELYITGDFIYINNERYNNIAKYRYKLPGQLGNELSVFMNDQNEEIIIEYEDSNSYSLEIRLFTIAGQFVKIYNIPNQQGHIHKAIGIPDLTSGVYIVEVIVGNKKVCKKLLKI